MLSELLPLPLETESEDGEFGWMGWDLWTNYSLGNMSDNGKATRDENDILVCPKNSHGSCESLQYQSACEFRVSDESNVAVGRFKFESWPVILEKGYYDAFATLDGLLFGEEVGGLTGRHRPRSRSTSSVAARQSQKRGLENHFSVQTRIVLYGRNRLCGHENCVRNGCDVLVP